MRSPPQAFSQIETARIQGVVSDSTGAVIPGATVKFVHVATGLEFSGSTSADGLYRSVPLRIGEYRVEFEADGFKRAVRSGINLELQETAVIDVSLEIGEVTEVVDVTADAVLLETTEATQGQVINNQRIVDMPLNGRDYVQLALLSAGAIRPIGRTLRRLQRREAREPHRTTTRWTAWTTTDCRSPPRAVAPRS